MGDEINPLIGVIMGSNSDWPTMAKAADVLSDFEIPHESLVVSAHRTPDRMYEYARAAESRGLKTIIAGAGGAAHLPGMVSALTTLPVLAVPVNGAHRVTTVRESIYSCRCWPTARRRSMCQGSCIRSTLSISLPVSR